VNHIEEAITKSPWFFSLLYQHFSKFLLTHFLLWLGHTANFNPNTLMINFWDTEALGINKAFSDKAVSVFLVLLAPLASLGEEYYHKDILPYFSDFSA